MTWQNTPFQVDAIAFELLQKGWACSQWPCEDTLLSLRSLALDANSKNFMRPAAIGPKEHPLIATKIRKDHILWLEEENIPVTSQDHKKANSFKAPASMWTTIEGLMLGFRRHLIPCQRSEFHLACYGAGAGYAKHLDAFRQKVSRMVSVVLYLNPVWHKDQGGALRIYREDNPDVAEADIIPSWGRAVFFLSQSIYHEVLTVQHGQRYSLAGWFRSDRIDSYPFA